MIPGEDLLERFKPDNGPLSLNLIMLVYVPDTDDRATFLRITGPDCEADFQWKSAEAHLRAGSPWPTTLRNVRILCSSKDMLRETGFGNKQDVSGARDHRALYVHFHQEPLKDQLEKRLHFPRQSAQCTQLQVRQTWY